MMRHINTTVRQILEDNGFKVDSYGDPHLALENFKPQYYDLVIIDSKMPQMDGFAFYKVKTLGKNVKTCFVTAADEQPEHYPDDTLPSPPLPNCFVRIPIENERLIEHTQEIMIPDK